MENGSFEKKSPCNSFGWAVVRMRHGPIPRGIRQTITAWSGVDNLPMLLGPGSSIPYLIGNSTYNPKKKLGPFKPKSFEIPMILGGNTLRSK